jgi:hypothetical protein
MTSEQACQHFPDVGSQRVGWFDSLDRREAELMHDLEVRLNFCQ